MAFQQQNKEEREREREKNNVLVNRKLKTHNWNVLFNSQRQKTASLYYPLPSEYCNRNCECELKICIIVSSVISLSGDPSTAPLALNLNFLSFTYHQTPTLLYVPKHNVIYCWNSFIIFFEIIKSYRVIRSTPKKKQNFRMWELIFFINFSIRFTYALKSSLSCKSYDTELNNTSKSFNLI